MLRNSLKDALKVAQKAQDQRTTSTLRLIIAALKDRDIAARSKGVEEGIDEKEILSGARGANAGDIRIHSVRLPGLVAHQEIIFGGQSQTLTIRHDSIHRNSFMPGVCLACKKVMDLKELVYCLEHVLQEK